MFFVKTKNIFKSFRKIIILKYLCILAPKIVNKFITGAISIWLQTLVT